MKYLLYSIMAIFTFIACACKTVYSDFQDTDQMQWAKNDKKKFVVDIPENAKYNLLFGMRYATGFPYKYIKVHIEQKLPNNEEQEKTVQFMIIGDDKKYIGDPLGQIWDFESSFAKAQKMEKGKYTYKITHAMNQKIVPAVMEVGLIVEKADN